MKSGHDVVTILLACVEGLHAVADRLTPEGLLSLLEDILSSCEARVEAAGGQVVEWDASGIPAARILCVWAPGPGVERVAFRELAGGILEEIRNALTRGVPPGAPATRVTVAVSRGPCLWTQEGTRITRVMGSVVNRCHQLCRGLPREDRGDALRLDDTVRTPD
jgi:class 3 adenylate cyclase